MFQTNNAIQLFTIFVIMFMMTMFVGSSIEQQHLILNKTICNDKRIEHVDRQFIRLIGIGRGGRNYPTKKEDVGPFCKYDVFSSLKTNELNHLVFSSYWIESRETDRITSDVEKFLNECLRDDASSVSKIFLYSTKRHWKTFCSKKRQKKQQKLLQVSNCFNTIINQIDCLEIFANRTRDLIPYNIGTDKIDYICW